MLLTTLPLRLPLLFLAIKAKDPSEMSVKELKKAIQSAGIGAQCVGFTEKHEFVTLLQTHLEGK